MQMSVMTEVQGHVAPSHQRRQQRSTWKKGKKCFPSFSFKLYNTSTQRAAVKLLNYKWSTYRKRYEDIDRLGILNLSHDPLDYHMSGTDGLTLVAHCGDTTISSREKNVLIDWWHDPQCLSGSLDLDHAAAEEAPTPSHTKSVAYLIILALFNHCALMRVLFSSGRFGLGNCIFTK